MERFTLRHMAVREGEEFEIGEGSTIDSIESVEWDSETGYFHIIVLRWLLADVDVGGKP